ncbi:MAG: hypothetical protein OEX08_01920 [Candidatus Nomurabacteria bacterium]|nr:hypothetical protein [Candidatus Nomurabacteria bacterium]
MKKRKLLIVVPNGIQDLRYRSAIDQKLMAVFGKIESVKTIGLVSDLVFANPDDTLTIAFEKITSSMEKFPDDYCFGNLTILQIEINSSIMKFIKGSKLVLKKENVDVDYFILQIDKTSKLVFFVDDKSLKILD